MRSIRFFTLALALSLAFATNALADITLTGAVRDFHMYPTGLPSPDPNIDFEHFLGDDRGIVTSMLGGDGKPVYAHPGGTPTTAGGSMHSPTDFFNQWYNNTPGYNINIPYSITLTPVGMTGLYQYSNSSFFPIDGMGFGNQGFGHNYSFTYEIDTTFGYTGSGVFTFSGDDDVFVYINNKLVIDLGGVHGEETATVDLTTLGLTSGNNYSLDVFFAERHTVGSDFRMTTDLALSDAAAAPEPASLTLLGIAGVCFGGYAWRRRKLAVA